MWPVSWAMTPITSFGFLASVSKPVWMKICIPLETKALMLLVVDDVDLDRIEVSRPAASKIGSA